jgi:DNA-binding winged helix-turn-helix (wHTH) protein
MPVWDAYPTDYRSEHVQPILAATKAGESSAVVGLSGAGKSNLAGFLTHRVDWPGRWLLLDCNRLSEINDRGFLALLAETLGGGPESDLNAIEALVRDHLNERSAGLALVIDRFEALDMDDYPQLATNLRALRDTFKYQLTFVSMSRRIPDVQNELAELYYGNTHWIAALNNADARWSVSRYADRQGVRWGADTQNALIEISGAYPSLLRGCCEAFHQGGGLSFAELSQHTAVRRRLDEFWSEPPSQEALLQSRLASHELLLSARPDLQDIHRVRLTAKERVLLDILEQNPGRVLPKDQLIRAVWPEDQIYESGVRDDSLAQLVRRLRKKIEPNPSEPEHIHTVSGRGYTYKGKVPPQG